MDSRDLFDSQWARTSQELKRSIIEPTRGIPQAPEWSALNGHITMLPESGFLFGRIGGSCSYKMHPLPLCRSRTRIFALLSPCRRRSLPTSANGGKKARNISLANEMNVLLGNCIADLRFGCLSFDLFLTIAAVAATSVSAAATTPIDVPTKDEWCATVRKRNILRSFLGTFYSLLTLGGSFGCSAKKGGADCFSLGRTSKRFATFSGPKPIDGGPEGIRCDLKDL